MLVWKSYSKEGNVFIRATWLFWLPVPLKQQAKKGLLAEVFVIDYQKEIGGFYIME
jgi:hypothetical protein